MGHNLNFRCKDCGKKFSYWLGPGMLDWDYDLKVIKAAYSGKYGKIDESKSEDNSLIIEPNVYVCHNCRIQKEFPVVNSEHKCPKCKHEMTPIFENNTFNMDERKKIYCPKCKSENIEDLPIMMFD